METILCRTRQPCGHVLLTHVADEGGFELLQSVSNFRSVATEFIYNEMFGARAEFLSFLSLLPCVRSYSLLIFD